MSRVKLYEHTSYNLLKDFGIPVPESMCIGLKTSYEEILNKFGSEPIVLKVDQGVKKRAKQGLIKIGISARESISMVEEWHASGWTNFIAVKKLDHSKENEHYLSLNRARSGWQISYSATGGVDVESHWDNVNAELPALVKEFVYEKLMPALDKLHISFIEMNPLLVMGDTIIPLDIAAEIDSAALSLPTLSKYQIIPSEDMSMSQSETDIATLDRSTPASLKFRLINPRGRIWMLLSGGGASLVLADEVADLGFGKELANYGEYSGAPSDDDTYAYTKIILNEIIHSPTHKNQAIIIAGGVANFTDVLKTFRGIIRALEEVASLLVEKQIKIFVRRGGPNEKKGLAIMAEFLKKHSLYGSVHGHEAPLTEVVSEAVRSLS